MAGRYDNFVYNRFQDKIQGFDILTDEYMASSNRSKYQKSDRDNLIASILETHNIQKETVRRMILNDSRLDATVKFLGYDLRPHHKAYADYIQSLRSRGQRRGLLLAPRGSGKSTICNTCYICMRLLQDPNLKVLIGSRTMEQAMAFLAAIKGNLVKPQIIETFGDLKGKKWDEKAIDVLGSEPGHKEHTIHVAGADGSVVSKHFDIIIADDLVEEKNAKTELQRETIRKFFYKSLLPCLKPGGELWVLGTKYHPEDLYTHLERTDPTFKNSVVIFPGVFDKDTGEPVDLVQKEIVGQAVYEVPENGMVWDEEGFPAEEVCDRRAGMTQGDFESQYQNRIDMLRGDYFSSEYFHYYSDPPEKLVTKNDLRIWTGVDLAISESDEADEFAVVTVGIERGTFNVYILDYMSGRFSFDEQIEIIKDTFDKWEPVHTYIESNAYQAAMQQSVVKRFPEVRAFPLNTTKDKITRAASLVAYYRLGRMYHRANRSAKLEGQLTAFPNRKLKDIFDALYFAVWGAVRGGRRKRKRDKEPGLFG